MSEITVITERFISVYFVTIESILDSAGAFLQNLSLNLFGLGGGLKFGGWV